MTKAVDPKKSPLLRALHDELVGPENEHDHYLKRAVIPVKAANTLARLYAAGGGRAQIGDFLEVLLKLALSQSEHLALAGLPEETVAEAKGKLFRITERKVAGAKGGQV